MSYILDALKKAESERKLGSVPNIYAVPIPGAAAHPEATWRRRLPWILVALMFVGFLAGVAALRPWRQEPPANTKPLATASTPEPVLEKAQANADVIKPAAIEHVPVPAEAKAAPAARADKSSNSTPAVPASAVATAPATSDDHHDQRKQGNSDASLSIVGTQQDLPENIRRELPTVAITGYIYADNPADRSVLIDKRLLHEGDQIGPDLVLEKMAPKSAILNYKGYRYRIAF